MSRVLIFLISYLLFSLNAVSQQYFVIHVKGEVSLMDGANITKIQPKSSFKLIESSRFSFNSPEALAVTVKDDGSKFVIKPPILNEERKSGELVYFARNSLLPLRQKTSSRAFEESFKGFLDSKKFLSIDGKVYVPKPKEVKNLYFQPKRKVVEAEVDTDHFIIDWNETGFLKIYLEKDQVFTSIYIVKSDSQSLQSILLPIEEALKNEAFSSDEVQNYLLGFIHDNYGYIPLMQLNEVLKMR